MERKEAELNVRERRLKEQEASLKHEMPGCLLTVLLGGVLWAIALYSLYQRGKAFLERKEAGLRRWEKKLESRETYLKQWQRELEKKIERGKRKAEELLNEALRLKREGRYAKAVRNCYEVLRREPKNWRAHHILGWIWAEVGDKEGAYEHLREAGRLAPPGIREMDQEAADRLRSQLQRRKPPSSPKRRGNFLEFWETKEQAGWGKNASLRTPFGVELPPSGA